MSSTHASTQSRLGRARLLLAGAAIVAAGLLSMPQPGFAFGSTISVTPNRPCGEDAPWSVTFSAGPTTRYDMEMRYEHGLAYSGLATPTSGWSPWMPDTVLYGPFTIDDIPANVTSVSIVVHAEWRVEGSEPAANQTSDWVTANRPDTYVCPTDTTTTTTTTTIPDTTTTTTTTIPETTTTTTSSTTTTTSTTVPPSSSTTEPPASTTTTPTTTTDPPASTTTAAPAPTTSVPGTTVTTVVDTTSSSTTVPVQQGGPVPSVSTTTVLVAQPDDDDPDPAAQLPATGGGDGSRGMVYAAGALLLAGSGAVAVSRRRHTA